MKKVALVTLMKNHSDLTMALLDSIYSNDDYDLDYLKIYVADTGSDYIEKQFMKDYIKKSEMNIIFLEYNYYNFAKINNDVIKNHVDKDTDLILLCNNDVQLINNAITRVIETYNSHDNVGTVGAMLLFTDYTIQHGGIIAKKNIHGIPNFTHSFYKEKYESKLSGCHRVIGNTGAFMLTSYSDFIDGGGLNENYKYCFEDVEYNLSLLKNKKVNLINYDALCFHKESSTRHQAVDGSDVYRIRKYFIDNIQD